MELINKNYDDCYFSIEDGYLESQYVFVDGNDLTNRFKQSICIGETGFGTGLNLLVLEDAIISGGFSELNVVFTTVEKFILEPSLVEKTLNKLKEITKLSLNRHMVLYSDLFSSLKNGWNYITIQREWGSLKINLFYGDVLDSFELYPVVNQAWFLDGHSPDKNPEMWSEKLFSYIAQQSENGTTFATFTAAGIVKRGLRSAGFFVKRRKGFGKKRHMILGSIK